MGVARPISSAGPKPTRSQKARLTYTSVPSVSRARRPTVSESSIAWRHAASVRSAACVRSTSLTCQRSSAVATAISVRNTPISTMGSRSHQGRSDSCSDSSR